VAATAQPGREPFDASHHCGAVFDDPEWISTGHRVIVNFDAKS
jgi:hypothetical protein